MAELSRKQREDLYVLRQTLQERRATDPVFLFEPTEKQRPFIESVLRGEKPENWFIAANRAGKSQAGAYIGACLARFGHDPKGVSRAKGSDVEVNDRATSGWVGAVDFPTARDVIQPKYFNNGFGTNMMDPFIPDREVDEWRTSDQVLKLKNGSIIGFKSYDSGRKKWQGAGKDWIHFDEEPPAEIYGEAVIRVEAGRRLWVFVTCTLLPPEGTAGGVTWSYNGVIKPWEQGKLKYLDCFGASIYDNPYLDAEEIHRLEERYPQGSVQRRIRLGGEWLPGLAGARAYPAFDRRLHLKEQGEVVARRPLCWWWDFNVDPMISGVGQKDGRIFRQFRTLKLDEGSIGDMVEMFVNAYPTHQGEIWVYGDATGRARNSQTGASCYQIIMNAMVNYGSPVRLKVPEANPFQVDRINAVNAALRDPQGNTVIEIDPEGNEDLIMDMEGVLRDAKGGIKKTTNRSDPYYLRTHASDGFGYWVVYDNPVRAEPNLVQRMVRMVQPGYAFGR